MRLGISKISKNGPSLKVVWSDGEISNFNFMWLRDNCPTAHDKDSNHRMFNILEMSTGIEPKIYKINNDGKVIFGSTINLENLDTGEKITYKIVGRDEADLKKKLIFFQSPIGRGLIGKNKSDFVEIKTPAGIKNFEIKDVKYI